MSIRWHLDLHPVTLLYNKSCVHLVRFRLTSSDTTIWWIRCPSDDIWTYIQSHYYMMNQVSIWWDLDLHPVTLLYDESGVHPMTFGLTSSHTTIWWIRCPSDDIWTYIQSHYYMMNQVSIWWDLDLRKCVFSVFMFNLHLSHHSLTCWISCCSFSGGSAIRAISSAYSRENIWDSSMFIPKFKPLRSSTRSLI